NLLSGNALVMQNPNNTYSGGTRVTTSNAVTGNLQVTTSDTVAGSTVVRGPLGTGELTLIAGLLQAGNTVSVSGSPFSYSSDSITLHNTVNLINSTATIGGVTPAGGGNINLAGLVNVLGTNSI